MTDPYNNIIPLKNLDYDQKSNFEAFTQKKHVTKPCKNNKSEDLNDRQATSADYKVEKHSLIDQLVFIGNNYRKYNQSIQINNLK